MIAKKKPSKNRKRYSVEDWLTEFKVVDRDGALYKIPICSCFHQRDAIRIRTALNAYEEARK